MSRENSTAPYGLDSVPGRRSSQPELSPKGDDANIDDIMETLSATVNSTLQITTALKEEEAKERARLELDISSAADASTSYGSRSGPSPSSKRNQAIRLALQKGEDMSRLLDPELDVSLNVSSPAPDVDASKISTSGFTAPPHLTQLQSENQRLKVSPSFMFFSSHFAFVFRVSYELTCLD